MFFMAIFNGRARSPLSPNFFLTRYNGNVKQKNTGTTIKNKIQIPSVPEHNTLIIFLLFMSFKYLMIYRQNTHISFKIK